jgi:Tfp pilus assembly protein PilX
MTLGKQTDSACNELGQVLLVVILVVIVASTIGLSLVSRSITSLRTSTEEAQSQKALSAAEAGIERAIQGIVPVTISRTDLSNDSYYSAAVFASLSPSFLINGGDSQNPVPKDEGADVWVVSHDDNGNPNYSEAKSVPNLSLYWGSGPENCSDSTAPAAIEVIVIQRNSAADIKSFRYAYDSCNAVRGNNFTQADSGSYVVGGVTFNHRTTPQNGLTGGIDNIIFLRVIPIYKNAVIAVSACDQTSNGPGVNCTSLPLQGYQIDATGISGDANKKIRVFKGWPQAYLPYLSYGLFVAN